jgi:hypothetical protein
MEFVEPPVKGSPAHAKSFRGFGPVALALLQCVDEQLSFGFFDRDMPGGNHLPRLLA